MSTPSRRATLLVSVAAVIAIGSVVTLVTVRTGGTNTSKKSTPPTTTPAAAPVTTPAASPLATIPTVVEDPPATTATTVAPAPTPTTVPKSVAPAAKPAPAVGCAPASDVAPSAAPAFPGDDVRNGQQWVTLGHASGRCDGSSAVFHLRGIDTRLLFRSDSGSLTVFLVDQRQGIDATAGYADAECSGMCSDSQVLVDQAGDYALQVRADGGPWEVAVQEYTRP